MGRGHCITKCFGIGNLARLGIITTGLVKGIRMPKGFIGVSGWLESILLSTMFSEVQYSVFVHIPKTSVEEVKSAWMKSNHR